MKSRYFYAQYVSWIRIYLHIEHKNSNISKKSTKPVCNLRMRLTSQFIFLSMVVTITSYVHNNVI